MPPQAISPRWPRLRWPGTIVANMTVKLGITLVYARAKGLSAAIALGASMVVLAVSIAVAWMPMESRHHDLRCPPDTADW